MNPDDAEALALTALASLASDPDELAAFLAESGLGPAEIRARARDPEFLGGVLDFIMAEDSRVLALAETAGLKPEMILRARGLLPGGAQTHWT